MASERWGAEEPTETLHTPDIEIIGDDAHREVYIHPEHLRNLIGAIRARAALKRSFTCYLGATWEARALDALADDMEAGRVIQTGEAP